MSKPPPGMVDVKVRISREDALTLKREALERDCSLGDVVSEALAGLMDFKNAAAPKERRK